MPTVSNLQTTNIPGFDNPLTSFEISLDDSPQDSGGNKSWRGVQLINSAGNGYGPHATTFGDIADKIPSKPSLKKSCEKCGKRPDQEGMGYSCCSSCKIARYCSRECQTTHWKEHKRLCQSRVKYVDIERDYAAKALRDNKPFVSQASLRKWYYDNVDIVDYAIVQALELYKGRARGLRRTHAVVFSLTGGNKDAATPVAASDISFSDAEAVSFTDLARPDTLEISPVYLNSLGSGSRIILIFVPNRNGDLILIESHDLPLDEEWAAMEKDDMWRMHIRMRDVAQMMNKSD
ncbi:MYND-type domain-containing protein [Mycena sanguinolenta]|uniref:MYND-type domain-containing protein n=1 Tax=Mycena sanguinolenta TaxID=230812 RepID=A0A8H6YNC7_9AGAR|nr:MYND-type domain-containing protein [Mycena sanguinolenta]